MPAPTLSLDVLPDELAVCRLPPHAVIDPPAAAAFWSLTRTVEELSLVCPAEQAPREATVERGWRALKVRGPLDFGLTGVLAALAAPLAQARLPIFVVSTYDTDYLLVRAADLPAAATALRAASHVLHEQTGGLTPP